LIVIIFNGPPGSGKDAACEFFKKLGFEHLYFKEELFKETFKFFNVSKEWFMEGYNDRSIKEKPVRELNINGNNLSRRDAMIYVSEEHIKPKYGNGYFGVKVSNLMRLDTNYCFSDGGFASELIPIINKIGSDNIRIVQLTRDGCDFSSDSRRYLHGDLIEEYVINKKTIISDLYVSSHKFPIRTYRIHNNGSIEQFESVLYKIYEKETNDQQGSKK
jgi:hypothetical protein